MWRLSDRDVCQKVDERLEAWVDGDLDGAERRRLEEHLQVCDACRRQAELARALSDELHALPRPDAPPQLIERVIRTVRAERRQDARAWSPWRIAAVGALAAALISAIVLLPGGVGDQWWGDREMRTASTGSASSSAAPEPADTGMDEVTQPGVDPLEVRRAADEARLALAYLSRASRKTGLELREELLSERLTGPAVEGLRALGLRSHKRGHDET